MLMDAFSKKMTLGLALFAALILLTMLMLRRDSVTPNPPGRAITAKTPRGQAAAQPTARLAQENMPDD